MWQRFKNFLTDLDKEVLSKDPVIEKKKGFKDFDFRGQKINANTVSDQRMQLSRDQLMNILEEHEPKMQPRKIRMKNAFYLTAFMAWNIGVFMFIMYRVKGDDLSDLEREAQERINMSRLNRN